MDMMVVKILGIVLVSLVFIATVLLMPRIFGVNEPSTTAERKADAPPSPAPVATARVAVARPAERPAKS